ncbi:MAG: hypothetical protein Q7O66_19835 [Dehalococcoidia bacterium]|nr:hypothetical protein [Dehalococcoidia bacterium]
MKAYIASIGRRTRYFSALPNAKKVMEDMYTGRADILWRSEWCDDEDDRKCIARFVVIKQLDHTEPDVVEQTITEIEIEE